VPKNEDLSIRAFREEVLAAIGNKNLIGVRSPDEFSGRRLAAAHLPRSSPSRPATSRPR
jgi:thiosulfate/3-mercaptopyruvate sulfurtransferase